LAGALAKPISEAGDNLVKGNHDIIDQEHYKKLNIAIVEDLQIGPLLMLHHPLAEDELQNAAGYVLCGHIHPGISLAGKARQQITLPCFAFGATQAILPSFGTFTGRVAIRSNKTDRIFAIANDRVLAID
jgi:metallophosphoesterase superfamily enzyme